MTDLTKLHFDDPIFTERAGRERAIAMRDFFAAIRSFFKPRIVRP